MFSSFYLQPLAFWKQKSQFGKGTFYTEIKKYKPMHDDECAHLSSAGFHHSDLRTTTQDRVTECGRKRHISRQCGGVGDFQESLSFARHLSSSELGYSLSPRTPSKAAIVASGQRNRETKARALRSTSRPDLREMRWRTLNARSDQRPCGKRVFVGENGWGRSLTVVFFNPSATVHRWVQKNVFGNAPHSKRGRIDKD